MADILALNAVSAGYGATAILDGLSLKVPAGKTVAVLGRNGVGKTTLLSTIMGHTNIHRGDIHFQGKDITRWPIHDRAVGGIGLVPQEREVFRSLTVRENLLIAARPGNWTLDAVLEMFPNLAERINSLGSNLSGGEQQMLAIGRALMTNPTLLLLDEPLEGLAPIIVEQLLNTLARLRSVEMLSMVLVEQHGRLALEASDWCVVLERGRSIHSGPSEALLSDRNLLETLIGVARRSEVVSG